MEFQRHPNTNKVFGQPEGWTEHEPPVDALPVIQAVQDNVPVIQSFWKPNAEELKAMNEGHWIILTIIGRGMPPVLLQVEAVKHA